MCFRVHYAEEGRKGGGQCRRGADGNPGSGASTRAGTEIGLGTRTQSEEPGGTWARGERGAGPQDNIPLAVSSGWRVSTTEVTATQLGFRESTLKMVEGDTEERKN